MARNINPFTNGLFKKIIKLAAVLAVLTGIRDSSNLASVWLHVMPSPQNVHDFSSLQQAINFAERREVIYSSVKIFIHPGIYHQAAIIRQGTSTSYHIVPYENKTMPIFDGYNKNLTWLTVRSREGDRSSIRVSGLMIKNYLTAISIEGNREVRSQFNSENVIDNNVFVNIGQHRDSQPVSTAVLRFVNSRKNTVKNNLFLNSKNIKDCSLLHVVYLAHHSSNNEIYANKFIRSCGSAVRIRDDSNYNSIMSNLFSLIDGDRFYDYWHCERKLHACTKVNDEVDSKGSVFEGNSTTSNGFILRKIIDHKFK